MMMTDGDGVVDDDEGDGNDDAADDGGNDGDLLGWFTHPSPWLSNSPQTSARGA